LDTFLHQQTTTSATETGTNRGGNFPSFPNGKPLEPADWNPPRPVAEKKRFPSIGHRFRGPLKETKPNRQAGVYMEIDGLLT